MRLIDADALMKEFAEFVKDSNNSDFADVPTWNDAVSLVGSAPTIEERKKGFWYALEKGDKGYSAGDFKCSVCGEPNRCYVPKPHFCPSCGADMRGENDGE